ncbi:MAG: TIGR00296 family protein [Thaumarchaeota archaeon]|nr:TIGR00296 family protein [Nitrososphaerota archaeon]
MELLSLNEGIYLVRLARKTIEVYLAGKSPAPPEDAPERLKRKQGVFVTLYTYPERELRGCIGVPMPEYPLLEATMRAAIASATEDPRFPPVSLDELSRIVVEVSALTPPEEIKFSDPKELPSLIRIGVDGLIIEAGGFSGLLLPQVPVEYGWTPEEYLMHLCLKAGLPTTYWLTGRLKLYRFTAQIFEEESPKGKIVEKKLKEHRP